MYVKNITPVRQEISNSCRTGVFLKAISLYFDSGATKILRILSHRCCPLYLSRITIDFRPVL